MAAEVVGVVDDRGEEVDRLHERQIAGQPPDARRRRPFVPRRAVAGRPRRPARRAARARRGGQLAAAAGAVGELGEPRPHLSSATVPEDRPFSDAELDAAVQALAEPERLRRGPAPRHAHRPPAPARAELRAGGGRLARGPRAEAAGGGRPRRTRRASRAVRTLLAEETRLGMLVGVAVGWELARELDGLNADDTEGTDTWTSAFSATPPSSCTDGDTRVLVDPFLTGNPKAAVEAGELEPTTILLTHGHADHSGDIVDIAKRTGARRGDRRAGRTRSARRAWTNVSTPTSAARSSSTGAGSGSSPAWHTSTTPERDGQHAGRPGDQLRRQDGLPPRRHRAVLRPAAGARRRDHSRRGADVRSAATTRWTATTR